MITPSHSQPNKEQEEIRRRFLKETGLNSVRVEEEVAGPECFLRFVVGHEAPIYKTALEHVNGDLQSDHVYYGRLSLNVKKFPILTSPEVDLLLSLIERSLRVTRDTPEKSPVVDFVQFRGREDQQVIQPANHLILGRRGVGKSSLILLGYRRAVSDGNIPVWIDLQAYHGRQDPLAVIEVLHDIFTEALADARTHEYDSGPLTAIQDELDKWRSAYDVSQTSDFLDRLAPSVNRNLRAFTRSLGKQMFVFLDDAHLVSPTLQPRLFDVVHAVLKGAGGWLKIAGVKNLLHPYDPSRKIGLESRHDVQQISLDLTLADPGAAKKHLTGVLDKFLCPCGLKTSTAIIPDRAVDRLVWCSAGVPRDFLVLLQRSVIFARQHGQRRVGVQEVNLAIGEVGAQKMRELEQDTSGEGSSLREALERLLQNVLDGHRSNSFLVRQNTENPGYKALHKLVDLRLVHLINPSITPSRAGDRHEAYLLDYSFYTGLRRRHRLAELRMNVDSPARYADLRKLPRVDLSILTDGSSPRDADRAD